MVRARVAFAGGVVEAFDGAVREIGRRRLGRRLEMRAPAVQDQTRGGEQQPGSFRWAELNHYRQLTPLKKLLMEATVLQGVAQFVILLFLTSPKRVSSIISPAPSGVKASVVLSPGVRAKAEPLGDLCGWSCALPVLESSQSGLQKVTKATK